MKTLRTSLLLLMMALLFGCTADMIANSDALGGLRDGPRWGIVRYLNQGADGVIKARQKNARRKMDKFCKPHQYRVTNVGERGEMVAMLGSSATGLFGAAGTFNYIYVRFECADTRL